MLDSPYSFGMHDHEPMPDPKAFAEPFAMTAAMPAGDIGPGA